MLYLSYAGYQMKRWVRDPFTRFVLFYPVILGALGRWVIPMAAEQGGLNLAPYNHVVVVALALITAKVTGVVAAFSILDDRDDRIFYTIRVAPLSFDFYIGLKMLLVYVLSFLGTAFVIWFSDLASIPGTTILSISLLAALGGPLFALLMNCVASNKIEGFAAMKSLNTLVVFPVVALFFADAKEFLFSFEPGFWPAKALSTAIIGKDIYVLSFNGYYFIGLVYAILVNVVAYRVFKKKVG